MKRVDRGEDGILAQCGEDRILAKLTRGIRRGAGVRVGIGDDCAVIGGRRDRVWRLLKTDAVVEGIHFLPESPPAWVGWKAMARPISDIASMGGLPEYALVTIAISPRAEMDYLQGIYSGIKRAARRFAVELVGGEMSRSPGPTFLSISLTGVVERARCATRSGGRPGDLLYVTGRLGGSGRGKHLRFIPRVEEGRWLTGNFAIRAMMDLSDGLGSDLPRLARAGGTGFEILRENLPCTKGCSVSDAISDGEDYELLLAVSPKDAPRLETTWKKRFPRLKLTRIGKLTPFSKKQPGLRRGHDHFSQPG